MRKLFLKISVLLFVLGIGTNAAWANLDPGQLPAQQLAQLMRPVYKAQMTGYTSSTGGGKVYIVLDEDDPRCEDNTCWREGTSNVALFGLGITTVESMPMTKANFRCWAQKDPGYFFTGWSFSNLGTDLANDADNVYTCSVSTSMDSTVIAYYTIYGTFEPIRIADYAISDGNTTAKPAEERYCEQTVVFSLYGDHISAADFKEPTVTGTPGTWTVTSWDYNDTNSEKVTVNVKFVAPDDDVAEYSANLLLETQAGIKMNVPLAARTIAPGVEALLFSKDNKTTPIERGTLTAMITAAGSTDVVKLNGDYASAVTIGKSLTLDLNGYTISNKLTVSGGNVTIAYSKYGGTINGTTGTAIDLTGGTLTLNGGHITASAIGVNIAAGATLNQNGATIEAASAILNNGTLVTTDGTAIGTSQCAVGASNGSTTTINGGSFFAGTSDAAVQIAGATAKAYIKKGTIASSTVSPYSQYGVSATDGAYVEIEKLAVINGNSYALKTDNGGSILVKGGKFNSPSNFQNEVTSDVTLNTAYFRNNYGCDENGAFKNKHLWRNTSGAEFREGYNYLAGEYADAQAAGVSVCHIGATSYTTLEDALAFANTTDESLTIILDNDYTLPAGYYTIPSNATLLIPYKDENVSVAKIVERETSYETPYKFRKLTLSDGVNWNVHGTIEVGGVQSSTAQTNTGAPTGAYGQLQMNAGSRVIMQSGATLRAWGYVTGDIEHKNTTTHEVPMGEIDVRRGATVYEMFEMGDWGSTISAGAGLMTNDSIFPLTHYFIQNVEVPTKYHPGAELISVTSVTELGSITMCANDIQIIGVSGVHTAMFLMNQEDDAENTWVRKWYNPVTDQQVYEVNSGAHIGQLIIPLVSSEVLSIVPQIKVGNNKVEDLLYSVAGVPKGTAFPTELVMNSGQYFLPLTTNFKIHVLTGTLDFTQSTELLPGCELEIDKEATVLITDEDKDGVQEGSLFIYDYRDWGNFAYGAYARKVSYSPIFGDAPSTRDISTAEALGSAQINVHGTFDTEYGYVFTTEHGGNIFSSVEDAGTFKFTNAAKAADYSEDIVQLQGKTRRTINCYPAYLKNSAEWVASGEDEYAHTGGTAANTAYCYLDIDGNGGHWTLLEQDGCFVHDALNDIYYIKPQEYVALANGKTANADHTFSDAAGTGRLFILLTDAEDNCLQWWEVEAKDNYYHCIHPENDTYYEWDSSKNKWVEKKFTITWKDWNGEPIRDAEDNPVVYQVPYGTQAEWLSTNPTRDKNLDYTYDFTGWSPALGKVTGDVTYTATYKEKQIKYTVVFVQDGGLEIERHFLTHNEVPVCENVPTRTGYILQWEPGIEPVVGNQTYTATWLPEPPDTFMVTFKNYDGTEILKYTGTGEHPAVEAGVAPTPPAADPSKPQTNEYTYAFTGWKGPKGFTAKNETLPVATENATYVAQFSENARTYEIKFYDENVSRVLKSENLEWGATPTPPAVSKTGTGYTYTYVWQNKADASKTIESVKGNADYKPVFTGTPNKYTVTLRSNLSGACTFTGAGTYDYGTSVSIAATPATGYEFIKWQETGNTNADLGEQTIAGDISLTAIVKEEGKGDLQDLNVGIKEVTTISEPTDVMNLIITSDGINASSQIINANKITLYGNADFVLDQAMTAGVWYSVAVPWRVEANGGIYLGNSSKPAVLGTDIEIIYYDGAERARNGKVDACWVWMKKISTKKILEPGRAYMFLIRHGSISKVTFRKKVQEPLLKTETRVEQYNSQTGNPADGGWNAIANPSLFHAVIDAGANDVVHGMNKGQVYEADNERYVEYDMSKSLVVGQPIYVQVPAAKSIVVNSGGYAPAPARRANTQIRPTNFELSLSANGTSLADKLTVRLNENKEENAYVIGQDLAKFGVSTKVAQMWIDRYNAKLCVNTMAPESETTSFPLGIYAPKAGNYTIAIEHAAEADDYALYLTKNGEAIANLSDGAYTLDLQKGTTTIYGLRISARAPQVATDLGAAVVDADGKTTKVLYNGQVFIIRGEKIYTVDGQLVK